VEACQIYQMVFARGWESASQSRISAAPTLGAPPSFRYDVEYWKQRLIHRRYPEPPYSQRVHELSVCIEHACVSQYFPLGTSEENESASKAMRIHQTVINKGWAAANACFPRELSLAFRWQDNPLAWTYTTIHTSSDSGTGKPVTERASPLPETRVVFIEPDSGIRSALAALANSMEGFRCDATFSGAAEAFREIPSRGADLAFANHDLPEAGMASLEDLQRVRPNLVVLSYSVFEDADHLFKSTPGGAVVYMLKRTSPGRIFEPIEELSGAPTREKIASHVRKYFQQLSALLPSGPPFSELAKLTPREHAVLAFLSKGDLAKEIAAKLGISKWTIQSHIKSIFEKLQVHTRTEAVIKYLRK
jgi:DNA-binding NarL/FixJ family response regulator